MGVNEIYARHGYEFKTEMWKVFFLNKDWYTINKDFNTTNFTDIENYNMITINNINVNMYDIVYNYLEKLDEVQVQILLLFLNFFLYQNLNEYFL